METSRFERIMQIVEAPDRELDLAEAALLIAQEEYPGLDVDGYLGRIARLAANVGRRLPAEACVGDAVFALNEYLFDEEGFAGVTEDHDLRHSFLNQVLDDHRGASISLAILYITVGRCLGLPLQGIALPGQFLVKFPVAEGSLVLDPYAGGLCLDEGDLHRRITKAFGEDVPEAYLPLLLTPAGKRDVVLTMLRELKHGFLQRQRYDKALWSVDFMLRIAPEQTRELRERGYLYEYLQHHNAAVADYERYLALVPDAADVEEVRSRLVGLYGSRAHYLH